MTSDSTLRPYGDLDPERLVGVPHLSDYWQVVSRRLWLVVAIFTVTTASSIWAVSRQVVYYRGHLSLQVNDPLERQRGLVTGTRVSGMDIFVDPIESEIQVLQSTLIASAVVDSVGLRLVRRPSGEPRSDLVRDVRVAPDAPNGPYQLVYDAGGSRAQFRAGDGTVLGTAEVGTRLDAGFVQFTLMAPPSEAVVYDLQIQPTEYVAAEVTGGLSAAPRENTNLIDVSYINRDRYIVPRVLNAAAVALREKGAERVRSVARGNLVFINEQLDSARVKLGRSQAAIQKFKETQAFTNLTAKEQQLVNRDQNLRKEMEDWDRQRTILFDLVRTIEDRGVADVDLVAVLAELPDGADRQIRNIIRDIQSRQADERRLLTEERKSEGHPQVVAVRAEIDALGGQLSDAAKANLNVIEARLRTLAQQVDSLRNEQRRFPELEGRLQSLQAQQTLDQDSYQYLLSQLYQAQITQAAASPYVEIIDRAVGAGEVSSRGRVNVFLGALLGIILGVGAAFFLEYLDRTVRTSSDVESLLGIPVLGVIPRLRRVDDEGHGETAVSGRGLPLVVAMDPLDPAAEAYRNLRMNLTFMSTDDDPIRSVLFSSPGPSEGKSTSAVNFAVMLAQQGQRVLLIDADLRRPSLHRALDVLREPGLTNLLIGDAETRETIRPSVLPNLDFLPSGPFPPNPSELLNSKAMARLMEDFEGRYDQIIIDSPPVLAVTDAAVLAVHADGAVLVLRSGETEQRAAERSVDQLRRLGVRVFGAILNEVSATTTDESYYLQYYYSYHPSPGSGWQRLREGFSKARFW